MNEIYLNNAATSFPKPESVLFAVRHYLDRPPCNSARLGFDHATDIEGECRTLIAQLIGAPSADRIAFSSGATESLNTAIQGLPLAGHMIVTTACEHNSVIRPLNTLKKNGVLDVAFVPCDSEGRVHAKEIEKRISSNAGNVGAIIINHCSNVTGARNDLRAIGALAKSNHIPFIVDASQSIGVFPIDVVDMQIDVLAFTGHKSLFGLQGVGGAYFGAEMNPTPLKTGGTGIRSDYPFQPEEMPLRLEAGTLNIPGIVAMGAGIRYIMDNDINGLRQKRERLCETIRTALESMDGVFVIPQTDPSQPSSMVAFTMEALDPEDVAYILLHSFGITVRAGLHCAPLIHQYIGTAPKGCVRVSPSCFTRTDECDAFIDAMTQIGAGL